MGSDTLWQIFVNILDKYFKPSLKPLWSQVSLILARSNPHVPFEGLISDHIVSMRITYYDILSEAFLFFYFLFFFFFFHENQVMYTLSLSQQRKAHRQSLSKTIPNAHSRWYAWVNSQRQRSNTKYHLEKDKDSRKEKAVIDTQLDETTSYLVIAKVVEEDSGEYSCEADPCPRTHVSPSLPPFPPLTFLPAWGSTFIVKRVGF